MRLSRPHWSSSIPNLHLLGFEGVGRCAEQIVY